MVFQRDYRYASVNGSADDAYTHMGRIFLPAIFTGNHHIVFYQVVFVLIANSVE